MRRKDRKREWRDEGIRKLGKDVRKTSERDETKKGGRSHRRYLTEGKKAIFE